MAEHRFEPRLWSRETEPPIAFTQGGTFPARTWSLPGRRGKRHARAKGACHTKPWRCEKHDVSGVVDRSGEEGEWGV